MSADKRFYNSGIKLEMEKPLACKIIEREELSSEAKRLVENELENLSRVNSSKVIKLVKEYRTHQRIYIFTEACNGGDIE